jgi:DNA-binding winged helix-turn-helix (wHTH) protein
LFLLASHAGDVVTREEIRQELWGHDTFVDFDGGLNFCVNQIRKALRDNAESPRFIHTLPRRGYRFIASVETVAVAPTVSESAAASPANGAHADAVAAGRGETSDREDDGGAPRARSGHLYEVRREPEPADRRWRPAGFSGFVRMATSPATAEEPAESPAAALRADTPVPLAQSDPALASPPRPAPAHATRRPGAPWAWAGLAIVLAAAISSVAIARRSRIEPTYERLTFRRGTLSSARFGPAGEITYGASWDGGPRRSYVTHPGETVARTLDLPDRTIGQKILASGELVVLIRRDTDGVLAVVPVNGGTPRELVEGVAWADVSADGSRIALIRSGPEDRVEFPPGHEIARATSKLNFLRLSPLGDRVAFLSHPVPGDDRGEVVTVDAAGKRTVLSGDWSSLEGLAWSPDGREVWFTGAKVGADSTLNAVALSGAERVVTRGPGRLVLHDIRKDGAVLIERATRRTELRGRFRGADGERDLSWLDLSMVTDLSPDGRTVVFSESGEGGGAGYGVFTRTTDGAPPVRLGEGRAMTISPDGGWVLTMPLFGPPRIVALPTGAGAPRTLALGFARHAWAAWFPDGKRVVFTAAEAKQPIRAYVQDLEGGPIRPLTGEVSMGPVLVAPDGERLLARTAGPAGQWQLYPIAGGPPQPAPFGKYDRPLAFTPDGRALFVSPWSETGPCRVERVDLATGQRTGWTEVRVEDKAGAGPMMPMVMTPDGQSYAFSVHRTLSELYLVRGLR